MTASLNMTVKSVLLLSLVSLAFGTNVGTNVSLESFNHEHRFVRHRDGKGFVIKIKSYLEKEDTDGKKGRQASTFKIHGGLVYPPETNARSFEPFDRPGYYLRQDENNRIVLSKYETNSISFAKSATFLETRENDCSNCVSFRSSLDTNTFIMEKEFELWVGPITEDQPKTTTLFKNVTANWAD